MPRDLPRTGDGLGGAARRAAPAARAAPRGLPGPAARVYVTENGAAYDDGLVDGRVDDPERVEFLDAYLGPSTTRSTRASTCAATSTGRCSTTSSGPGATTSGSASCASTTRRSAGRRRPARTGIARGGPHGWPSAPDSADDTGLDTVTAVNSQPTLDEVARVAGVSRATASRAINGGSRVSSPRPARGRRGRRGRSATCPTRPRAVLVTPPHRLGRGDRARSRTSGSSATRSSPARCAGSTGCSPSATSSSCCCSRRPAPRVRARCATSRTATSTAPSSSPTTATTGWPPTSRPIGLPCVFVGRPWTGADAGRRYVDVDNVAGGRDATRLLVERGCRRIGDHRRPART